MDGIEGGWTLEDTVAFARELKARGVDLVDCSSSGLAGSATAARVPRGPGFQVPFAARIRREAELMTMAVGLIVEPQQAEDILNKGQADLVAIGREALFDPNWPAHAERALGAAGDGVFASWPVQARLVARTPRARIAGASRQGGGRVRRIDAQTGMSAARGASLRAISSMVANIIAGECACSASGRV